MRTRCPSQGICIYYIYAYNRVSIGVYMYVCIWLAIYMQWWSNRVGSALMQRGFVDLFSFSGLSDSSALIPGFVFELQGCSFCSSIWVTRINTNQSSPIFNKRPVCNQVGRSNLNWLRPIGKGGVFRGFWVQTPSQWICSCCKSPKLMQSPAKIPPPPNLKKSMTRLTNELLPRVGKLANYFVGSL